MMRTPTVRHDHCSSRPDATARCWIWRIVLVVCSTVLLPTESAAQVDSPEQTVTLDITPADLLARTDLLGREIEEIRRVMGKPLCRQFSMIIRSAQPREVYYLAQALYRKADRFAFEVTKTRRAVPATPSSDITPQDVLTVLDSSLERIRMAGGHVPTRLYFPGRKFPSHVFQRAELLRRQLTVLNDVVGNDRPDSD